MTQWDPGNTDGQFCPESLFADPLAHVGIQNPPILIKAIEAPVDKHTPDPNWIIQSPRLLLYHSKYLRYGTRIAAGEAGKSLG
jgi:hypothetical protein